MPPEDTLTEGQGDPNGDAQDVAAALAALEQVAGDGADAGATANGTEAGATEHTTTITDLATAQAEIARLRQENANRRVQARDARQALQARIDALQAKIDAEEERKLADNAQFKELAERRAAELEAQKARLAEIEAKMKDSVGKRVQAVPETMRSLIPDYDDVFALNAWLDANADKLTPQRAPLPNLDGGKQGERGGAREDLTAAEQEMARRLGVSTEAYLARKRAAEA